MMKRTTPLASMLAAALVSNAQTSVTEKEASDNPSIIQYQPIKPVTIIEEDYLHEETRKPGSLSI